MKRTKYQKKITKYLKRKIKEAYLKLLPNNQLFISPLGFKMNLSLDKQVDKEIYMGIFEIETQDFYTEILSNGMTIFDIGANKGLYSLIAATKIGFTGKVFSFEPAPKAYEDLLKNILLNNFSNISPFRLGVSDKEGEVILNICEDDAFNSIGVNPLIPVKERQAIETTSIDIFCKKNNIDKIDLIKIDTEGAEELVLKGGIKTLSSEYGPILICEYNSKSDYGMVGSTNDIFNILKGMGYFIYEFKSRKLVKFNLEKYSSTEIFCLKARHIRMLSKYIIS